MTGPLPGYPREIRTKPYYLRQDEDWALQQQRQSHAQAIYMIGEWAMFFLMWRVVDFEAGRVQRCSVCYPAGDPLATRVANVYDQPHKNKCPSCFGTTFEGGYRARIVRPAIFTDTDDNEGVSARGAVHPSDVTVESTWDFRVYAGDYVVRADNTRWQLGRPQRVTLRTGFETPDQADTSLTYGNIRAGFEEPTTVVYTLPPIAAVDIATILGAPMQYPGDFTAHEDINGPLIPSGG